MHYAPPFPTPLRFCHNFCFHSEGTDAAEPHKPDTLQRFTSRIKHVMVTLGQWAEGDKYYGLMVRLSDVILDGATQAVENGGNDASDELVRLKPAFSSLVSYATQVAKVAEEERAGKLRGQIKGFCRKLAVMIESENDEDKLELICLGCKKLEEMEQKNKQQENFIQEQKQESFQLEAWVVCDASIVPKNPARQERLDKSLERIAVLGAKVKDAEERIRKSKEKERDIRDVILRLSTLEEMVVDPNMKAEKVKEEFNLAWCELERDLSSHNLLAEEAVGKENEGEEAVLLEERSLEKEKCSSEEPGERAALRVLL